MTFIPIKQKKISVQIAEQIRRSIMSGEFAPGDRLPPERELAEMFGVSRPSVREALKVLGSSGLVEVLQGGGTTVKSLMEQGSGNTLGEMIRVEQERALDVIEVRKCMESWTAYFAAQRALPEDLRRMEEIIDGMRQNLELLQPSEDLDANFHLAVARATHNIVWLHLMQNIFDAMKEFQRGVWRAIYLTTKDQHQLFSHHQAVYQAINNRDAERARTLMLEHLGFAEDRSNLYLKKLREGV